MTMTSSSRRPSHRRHHAQSLVLLPWLLLIQFLGSSHAFVQPRVFLPQQKQRGLRQHPETCLNALIPLTVPELSQLLSTGSPTSAQFSTYWGRTSRETYARWNEAALVMVLGTLLSYCLSFVVGGFVATLLGVVCCFYAILGPELQATQRNWELLGGRSLVDPWIVEAEGEWDREDQQGLYGALFLGRVADISVVEDVQSTIEYDFGDFQDYTMEYDELEQYTGSPYLLRVRLQDLDGRTLQVHARMSEEYLSLTPQDGVAGILLSTSQKFTSLAALTDFVVPDAECWIGDYPYLNRFEMERLLADRENDGLLWDTLELESSAGEKIRRSDQKGVSFNSDDAGDYWSPELERVSIRRNKRTQ